jgi:hypothetical protein
MSPSGPALCPHCQDLIGHYEPVVALDPEGIRITSLAREPEIDDACFEVLHRHCFLNRLPTPDIRILP